MRRAVGLALFLNAFVLVAWMLRDLRVSAQTGPVPVSAASGDLNGDCSTDVSDAIYLLLHLFRGGPPPLACAETIGLEDRIVMLEARLAVLGDRVETGLGGLTAQVEALEGRETLTPEQAEILGHVSLVRLDDGQGNTAKTVRLAGVNLQIVNGLEATNGDPTQPYNNSGSPRVNGLGNVIVGYQEFRPYAMAVQDRTGSHNVIVGTQHNYSSYGGLVVGYENTISGEWSVVSAGAHCLASGNTACVSGGRKNVASGEYASISGGHQNTAASRAATVCGGRFNIASGQYSTVGGGGTDHDASDLKNVAAADYSYVAGGRNNQATQTRASVFGGQTNEASAFQATVLGGTNNHASGDNSTVTGGDHNTASGENASVSGGLNRSVSGAMDWRAGELFQGQ